MRNFLRNFLPSHEAVRSNRWLKLAGPWLNRPSLWHLHRRGVAAGVGVGLFCGLIPGPLQMISAALLAVLLRANLPVALLATLYTNPFTIVPLYLLAYRLGAWVYGVDMVHPSLPEAGWAEWGGQMAGLFSELGKPLAVGLPLLAVILSISGYLLVRMLWRISVIVRWRARRRSRQGG